MGKRSSKHNQETTYDHTIYVQTGDRPKAGTDANVYVILYGKDGQASGVTKLDCFFHDDFERGQLDKFKIKRQKFDEVAWLELWRDDAGLYSDWHIDTIAVVSEATGVKKVFPVFRWIRANYHYKFIHLDTCLPQQDSRKDQRQKDLEEKRENYQLESKAPGLFPQVKKLPADENFSFDYLWDITKLKAKLILTGKLVMFTSGNWKSIDDIKNVFTDKVFTIPTETDRWLDDRAFGRQRIAGMNNVLIRLCKEIPENLGVTQEMMSPILEGLSLQEAMDEKRLFLINHDILDGCPTGDGVVTCAPIAIFFQNGKGHLMPVAIQLLQNKSSDNPVFLPTDPKYTWVMAKMWFNNADTGIHQAVTHLGFTHLIMEGICITTHRNLSQSHPLFKLMAPHFLYIIAINARALEKLVAPGGWIDVTMTIAVKGLFELVRRHRLKWQMSVDGILPEDLKSRGVDDPNILPEYHFREDALLLFDVVKSYVTKYVSLYYDTPEKIAEDTELQSWRTEMVTPLEDGGCGLLGVPGKGGFTTKEEVITVLTCIVYTCSVGHAAANFKQYDEYAFPPNCPAKLHGTPPKDKTPLTEADVLKSLPNKETTLNTMVVTKILSERATRPLGDFEVQYVYDPAALEIIEQFRQDLKRVGKIINERNANRNPPYPYLDPAEIPNAISI